MKIAYFKFTKRDLNWLVVVIGLFVVFGVIAYGSTSAPSVFGHSAGEVDVNIPGVGTKTLQQAITDGNLGGSGVNGWDPNACRELCQTSSNTADNTLLSCDADEVVAKARWAKTPTGVDAEHLCITCCDLA